jgi:succinate dehydrogenase/fumarate reductase flavoprotein subunit
MPQHPGQEDAACDVLIVGSGAAGMATAITAHHLGLNALVA